jgi:hypothetical protein
MSREWAQGEEAREYSSDNMLCKGCANRPLGWRVVRSSVTGAIHHVMQHDQSQPIRTSRTGLPQPARNSADRVAEIDERTTGRHSNPYLLWDTSSHIPFTSECNAGCLGLALLAVLWWNTVFAALAEE